MRLPRNVIAEGIGAVGAEGKARRHHRLVARTGGIGCRGGGRNRALLGVEAQGKSAFERNGPE